MGAANDSCGLVMKEDITQQNIILVVVLCVVVC